MRAAEAHMKKAQGKKGTDKIRERHQLAISTVDSLVDLMTAGFSEKEVLYEWPYDKFRMFSNACGRRRIEDRVDFVVDVAQAIGGLFGGGKGKRNPATEHIDQLKAHIEKLNVSY